MSNGIAINSINERRDRLNKFRLIVLAGCLIFLTACSEEEGVVSLNSEPQTHRVITASQAKEMIANNDDVVIVDVRSPEEFASEHIKGAISIPTGEVETLAPLLLTDINQTILVYCRAGSRSHYASLILSNMGFSAVYDFGGILDWYGDVVSD